MTRSVPGPDDIVCLVVSCRSSVKDERHGLQTVVLTDEHMALLNRAFPNGVPPEEVAYLRALPRRKAKTVLLRLDAVIRSCSGMRVKEGAKATGLCVGRFCEIKGDWKRFRSVRALTPFARVGDRRAKRREEAAAARNLRKSLWKNAEDAEIAATRLVSTTPTNVPSSLLALRMMRRFQSVVSYEDAIHLIQRVRRRALLSSPELPDNYGSGVTLDICAIDMVVEGPQGGLEVARLAFVFENVSSLILGLSVGAGTDLVKIQYAAVVDALIKIESLQLDRQSGEGEPATCAFPSEMLPVLGLASQHAATSATSTFAAGSRRYGAESVERVGPDLMGLRFLPRVTYGEELDAMSSEGCLPMTLEKARILIEDVVCRRNAPIEEAVRQVVQLGPRGILRETLMEAMRVFGGSVT